MEDRIYYTCLEWETPNEELDSTQYYVGKEIRQMYAGSGVRLVWWERYAEQESEDSDVAGFWLYKLSDKTYWYTDSVSLETMMCPDDLTIRGVYMEDAELYYMNTNEPIPMLDLYLVQVAKRIREADEWPLPECRMLCYLAGLEKEWNEATGETFIKVLERAAEKLRVNIYN